MRLVPEAAPFVRRGGALVRRGYEEDLTAWLASEFGADSSVEGGRGGSRRVALCDGGFAYVKRYRHGGLLRRLLGDVYWQRPARPWRELAVTEAARRSGVVAPEVLAAAVEPLLFGVLYRGVLVTREIAGRRSLARVLQGASSDAERRDWIAGAWSAVTHLHAAGIRHPDLNVTNFLFGERAADVALIDFDRAAVGRRPVGLIGQAFARRRLARSIAKLALPGFDRAQVARLLVLPARLRAEGGASGAPQVREGRR